MYSTTKAALAAVLFADAASAGSVWTGGKLDGKTLKFLTRFNNILAIFLVVKFFVIVIHFISDEILDQFYWEFLTPGCHIEKKLFVCQISEVLLVQLLEHADE